MVQSNILRIIGMAFAMVWISSVVWAFLQPLWNYSHGLFIAKDIVLTALITFIFVRWFFIESKIVPTGYRGLQLGLLVLVITAGSAFIEGFLVGLMGMPTPVSPYMDMSAWYELFQDSLALVMLVSAWGTGAYLAKKR